MYFKKLFLVTILCLFSSVSWSQEDATANEPLDFLELLSGGNYDLWRCSPVGSDDEGNPTENAYILEMDENSNITRGEPIIIRATITIFKNYDGYAQVTFGNTIYPVPDGGRFYTNQYTKDGSTLIGAIVDKSENKYGLAGGTDFGPLASIWLLDTDRGKLTIGTNDYGIDIFEGCELAREEE